MNHKINHANIKEWAANYDGPLFDGVLCDPPYELNFMNSTWDNTGIAFDVEMWADIYKLLKPGAHLLAFSGSRTYHRMAVAIEDAGFEPRDMLVYCYGSGFPKSLNIGKAVDKIQGNEREDLGYNPNARPNTVGRQSNAMAGEYSYENLTKGTSEWEGYGTALKPAIEPIILARKPISEKNIALNVLKHGTGGLNIDGTRVGTDGGGTNCNNRNANGDCLGHSDYDRSTENQTIHTKDKGITGRFPANLIHDGSDEVEAVFPNESSRFFYTAKASKSERNAGLEGFEDRLGGSLEGGNDKRKGDRPQLQPTKNHHPTVKPLSLTKYLATLIKPPTGGRLLVPFSGSGSEMIGALQAGWEYVEGVELTEEYIPIAEARIKYWLKEKEAESKQLALV